MVFQAGDLEATPNGLSTEIHCRLEGNVVGRRTVVAASDGTHRRALRAERRP